MKWFKHISDSLDDPFIFELIDKFGGDGYLVFFGTLEILSREFDINSPGFSTFSERFLSKKLQLSRHKMLKILSFVEKKERFFIKQLDGDISISCPKLKDICDEYTQKMLKKIGTESGANRAEIHLEEEVEVEVDYIKEQNGKKQGTSDPGDQSPVSSKNHYSNLVGKYLPRIEKAAIEIKNLDQNKNLGFNPFQFVQKKIKDGIHPKIITDALESIRDHWSDIKGDPWQYTSKMMKRAQIDKESEGFKTIGDQKLDTGVVKALAAFMEKSAVMNRLKDSEAAQLEKLRKQKEILIGQQSKRPLW